MAQLLIAAAGAVIGGAIPGFGIAALGLSGSALGWTIGSLVGSAFAPGQKSSGPRLSDLSVSSSAYGTPIPYVQGTPRIAGQIVWASTKREIATTTRQGKGGGGSKFTSYTYEVDLMILLTDNEIAGVRRIWSNGELVFTMDATASTDSLVASASASLWSRMTVYTGSASQPPDPDYEAAVDYAPAYRGRGTVFIKSLQLGNSGQLPNLTFEVVSSGTLATTGVATDGLLCHADALVSTGIVESAIGPDMTQTVNGSLSTSVKKFGAAAIDGADSVATGTAANVAGNLATNWRLECWAFVDPATFSRLRIQLDAGGAVTGPSFSRTIAIGSFSFFSDAAISFSYQTAATTGGGRGGLYANGPIDSAWNHFCIQYEHPNTLTLYVNGRNVYHDFVGPDSGVVEHFLPLETWFESPQALCNITVSGPVDEVYFHALAPGEPIYGNEFAVPTVPYTGLEYIDVVDTITANPVTLQTVVSELSEKAGLTAAQFDASDLASITLPVRSMVISQVSPTRSAIDMLAQSYFFDIVLRDKLYYVARGGAAAATLAYDELGAMQSGSESPDPFPLTQANELEVPAQISLTYSNIDFDHQSDTQYSDRLLTGQESTSAIQVPLGFTPSDAKQIVDRMLADQAWRLSASFTLDAGFTRLEPSDVVQITDADGSSYRIRIMRRSDSGSVITFDGVIDDVSTLTQAGTTSAPTAGQSTVSALPNTNMELLDIPMLSDSQNEPGIYVAVNGETAAWSVGAVYESADDITYGLTTTVTSQTAIGSCTTTLGNWTGGNVFDMSNSVTVDVGLIQQLSSYTRTEILTGSAPGYVVGSELIYALDATLVSAGVYTLTGLLRGRRGTEWAMAGHAASERFVKLSPTFSGLRWLTLNAGDLAGLRYYKGVSAGQALSAVTAQTITPLGVTLKPFSPVDARVNRDATDHVITWKRRTRMSTRLTGSLPISAPLGETSEIYEVEIFASSAAATAGTPVLRTLTSSTASVTYTSAQRTTDGTGSTVVYMRVYQLSASVGRGYPLTTQG